MSLASRNAIVTGSTSGIGLAIARALAKEGANIMINGFGEAGAIETERETFRASDVDPTALSNQFRSRVQTSLVGEYRIDAGDWLGGGFAVRGNITREVNAKMGAGCSVHAVKENPRKSTYKSASNLMANF
jgi:NAD(P)-dependent dehydrogenase (short-subunit alcohol dehydrogenase family)